MTKQMEITTRIYGDISSVGLHNREWWCRPRPGVLESYLALEVEAKKARNHAGRIAFAPQVHQ